MGNRVWVLLFVYSTFFLCFARNQFYFSTTILFQNFCNCKYWPFFTHYHHWSLLRIFTCSTYTPLSGYKKDIKYCFRSEIMSLKKHLFHPICNKCQTNFLFLKIVFDLKKIFFAYFWWPRVRLDSIWLWHVGVTSSRKYHWNLRTR